MSCVKDSALAAADVCSINCRLNLARRNALGVSGGLLYNMIAPLRPFLLPHHLDSLTPHKVYCRFTLIPPRSTPLRALLAIAEATIDLKQHIVWQISEADRARVLQVTEGQWPALGVARAGEDGAVMRFLMRARAFASASFGLWKDGAIELVTP